jgi:histidinol-phosphate/aromatic aminotransferase/cobyric acid decarboxylase-like protein
MLRLDRLGNPRTPIDAVREALADIDLVPLDEFGLAQGLRRRIAGMLGLDTRWIVLAAGIDALYDAIVAWRLQSGPFTVFPPTRLAELQRVLDLGGDIAVVPRAEGFELGLSRVEKRLPPDTTSVVMSPNDPTGTLVDLQALVRLSRQSAMVVIDERHGAYTPRTAAPFAREFDNVVVLQSMEWWAGLCELPVAWAICPPSQGEKLTARQPGRAALLAAHATLDDWLWMRHILHQTTTEKGRLYRQLRKLNMLHAPYPSWANFVLTRFARGGVEFFLPRLEERGIRVHVPDQDLLPDHIRVSAASAEATDTFKRALIEIALEL